MSMKQRGQSHNSVVLSAYTEAAKGFGLTLDEFMDGINAGWISVTLEPEQHSPYRFVMVARGYGKC